MTLLLVVHDQGPAITEALEGAVWELSESHWLLGSSLIVSTSVSAAYLSRHLRQALDRAALSAGVLVTTLAAETALDGLPEEGRAWLERTLPPQG